jgi:ribose transport system substrate-binding protein
MRTRMFGLFVMVAIVLVAAACSTGAGTTTTGAPAPEETTPPTTVAGTLDITAVCGTEPITVALADGFGGNSWRRITRAEFEDEAAKCPNIETVYTDAQGDQEQANADINSLVAQGVDAIVVYADFGEGQLPAIRAAHEQGVAILPYLSDPGGTPGEDYVAFVDEDRDRIGQQWADWIGDTVGEGDIIFLGGIPGNPSSLRFIESLKSGLESHPGINLLSDTPIDTNWDPAEYQRVMAGLFTQYENIDGIVTDYGIGFIGAIRAYEAANEPLPPVAALASGNENGCLWEELSPENPEFEFMTVDGTTQVVRTALRKAVAAAQGLDDPFPDIVPLVIFADTTAGNPPPCVPELPPDADLSSSLTADQLAALFN